MTDQQPAGWYPDPTSPGHQRQWDGQQWVGDPMPIGPAAPTPPPAKAKSGFPKWLIPVIACLALGFIAVVIGALAGSPDDDKAADDTTTTTTDPTAGQFARCNDGEYSDNGDLRAICSSHDGVAEFLAAYGECEGGSIIALTNDPECPNGEDLARLLPDDFEPEAGPDDIALCQDGTYSDNRDLRATCSSHDGVDEWLAEYGECEGGDVVHLASDERCPVGEDLSALLHGYTPTTTTTTTTAPSAEAQLGSWYAENGPVVDSLSDRLGSVSAAAEAVDVSALNVACQGLRADVDRALAVAPIPLPDTERLWRDALREFSSAADLCIEGTTGGVDPGLITEAATAITTGSDLLQQATESLPR